MHEDPVDSLLILTNVFFCVAVHKSMSIIIKFLAHQCIMHMHVMHIDRVVHISQQKGGYNDKLVIKAKRSVALILS